jgi:choline-sulfatase
MKLKKKNLIYLVMVLVVLSIISCSNTKYKGYNILLISIDTLRADHLSCYGNPNMTSPTIDKFSKNSVLFQSHFSQAPTTTASHMTIFTSLYPSAHGLKNWEDQKINASTKSLSDKIKTITEILAEKGYNNYSYNGGGNISHLLGFGRGFKIYRENAEYEILDWLDNPPPSPFFIFFHTYQVHDPYNPFKPLDKLFDPDYTGKIISSAEDMTSTLKNKYGYNNDDFMSVRDTFWNSLNKSDYPREVHHMESLYDAEIFEVDLFLNKLFKKLKELGVYDKTIVVLLSDHGEEFYEHKDFLHERLYNETLHVPLIVDVPGNKTGIVSSQTRNIDVMPTILDIIGISKPKDIQGEKITNLLFGGSVSDRLIFSESQDLRQSKSIQTDNHYKLIYNQNSYLPDKTPVFKELPPLELFDIGKDPGESDNLFSTMKNDKTTKELLTHLKGFMDQNEKLSKYSKGSKIKYDKETEDKLRSLGYIN